MGSGTEPSLVDRIPAIFVKGVLLMGVFVIIWRFVSSGENAETVSVEVPELSAPAARGKVAFDANCAACHGANASGSGKGPPLIHDIYNPGHHADAAFQSAVRRGVRQHHWPFGNMPPQPEVSDQEVTAIIHYVRELQQANGIFYRQHKM